MLKERGGYFTPRILSDVVELHKELTGSMPAIIDSQKVWVPPHGHKVRIYVEPNFDISVDEWESALLERGLLGDDEEF